MAIDPKNINKDDYFVIPNPIYDVVFKYLMEDNESAKIIISTLINKKIKTLNFEPTSHSEKITDPDSQKDIRLFHLDFTALIEKEDGTDELIMIEVQKASEPSDIFRFKRYISKNFQKKVNREVVNPKSQAIETIERPIKLLPIFILNFRIENEINDLIIKINRNKHGIFKEKELFKDNDFIDNLGYDMLVIQLPNLRNITPQDYENNEYKTKLYSLMKLFDQDAKTKDNRHRLMLMKVIFPEFMQRLIRRLKSADSDNIELEESMLIEDEYLAELIKRQNSILEKETIIKEKEKALIEKETKLKEKDKSIESSRNTIIEMAKVLKSGGMSISELKTRFSLPDTEAESL